MAYDFSQFDLSHVIKPQEKAPLDVFILRLILASMSGLIPAQNTSTPEKVTAAVPGTVQNAISVTFVIHSSDATIDSDLCEDGRAYTFTAPQNSKLADLSYNPGTGTIEILTVK